jgi:hypothetical protein
VLSPVRVGQVSTMTTSDRPLDPTFTPRGSLGTSSTQPSLTWDGKNQELRTALHLDGTPLRQHAIKIAELRWRYHHTIVQVDADTAPFVFCLPYALNLCESLRRVINKTYKQLIIGKNLSFVGLPFADWLRGGLKPIERPEPGCLVFYFKSRLWAHAGTLVRDGVVKSKWGMFPAYEHGIWEIPVIYGDEIRCYQMPGEREVVRLFLQFSRLVATGGNVQLCTSSGNAVPFSRPEEPLNRIHGEGADC